MNTVQRLPRSTGAVASVAARAKLATSEPIVSAKVCRNEPQPDEQASFTAMESITPSLTRRYFMSCPPMSITEVTPGASASAAR